MSLFPMFLKLEGRSCLVVGADTIGQSKIRSLLVAGASVRVVAPRATAAIIEWARAGLITWEARDFNAADLDGLFLVVAATSSSDVNEATFREAQRRGVLCNVVDDPAHCDFYYPALVRRGQLQLAISTGGRSPEYAGWLEELGRAREQLFGSEIESEDRRRRLHELASRQAFEALQPRSQAKGEIHDG